MIRTVLLAVLLLACKHKPAEPTSGSAGSAVGSPVEGSGSGASPSAGSAAAGSATAGSAAAGSANAATSGSAGSAAPVAQPKRSAQDTAAFADADKAVADAMAKAHSVKTAQEACAAIDQLMTKLNVLDKVTPPKGTEHEFADGVNGIGMLLSDIKSTTCADPQSDASDVADRLDQMRHKLDVLEGIGAK